MQKSPGKKELSLPIREEKSKNTEEIAFFKKGKARNLRPDAKKG